MGLLALLPSFAESLFVPAAILMSLRVESLLSPQAEAHRFSLTVYLVTSTLTESSPLTRFIHVCMSLDCARLVKERLNKFLHHVPSKPLPEGSSSLTYLAPSLDLVS